MKYTNVDAYLDACRKAADEWKRTGKYNGPKLSDCSDEVRKALGSGPRR